MKVVENVFEKMFCRIMTANNIKFGFLFEKGACAKEKSCIYVLWF